MKRAIALALAVLTGVCAPGKTSYAAAAGTVRSTVSRPSPVLALPAGAPGLNLLGGPAGVSLSRPGLPAATAASGAPAGSISPLAAPASLAAGALPGAPPNAGASVVPARGNAPLAAQSNAAQPPRDGPAALGQAQGAAAGADAQKSGVGAGSPSEAPAAGAAGIFDGMARGKSILLVGTSGTRPFILEETKRVAEQLGLKLYLLDKPEARAASKDSVPDARFIAAPIDNHDKGVSDAIVDQVAAFAKENSIDAVVSFLNPFSILAGQLADRLGAKGNSAAAVEAAHTKSLAREKMNQVPEIATPSRVVRSVEEARAFYRELGGGKVVMKPIKGGGSQGVVTDIASEAETAQAFEGLTKYLAEFAKRPDAGFYILDQAPEIMIERQLVGPEVDVELVIQNGEAKFANVADNAPMDRPHAVEKNSTYSSQLPEPIQAQLIEAAVKAVRALGLKDGNMHVELMMTPEGPRVLEVNARMGGAFVWEFIRDTTGISLVEQGIRAVLGLSVDAGRKPAVTIEARFLIPKATGRLEAMEGLEALEKREGFVRAKMLKKVGDLVQAAPDSSFDYFGYVGFSGKDYQEAMARMMAGLESVKFQIRKADGALVEQTAAYTHEPVDMTALLAPEQRPDALERRDRIMYGYLRGQLALVASFAIYYSLFSPVASALAGVSGMGSGRNGYSAALAILRPISGVLVERFSTRAILIGAFAARAILWAAVLPAAFFLLGGGGAFLAAFVGLMFIDGAIVSINALVDIDEGGIDMLGKQHAFPVDHALRIKYNAVLGMVYSASRVVLAPAMAALGIVAAGALSSAAAALVVVMALSFAVPAAIGIYYYARYIPAKADMGEARARQPLGAELREIGANLKAGFSLAWNSKKIRWRIGFNAMERAIDDSMLFVMLAEFGMKVLAPGDPAYGALYTAGLIAFGKIGAIVSSYLMGKKWNAPKAGEAMYPKYKGFFKLAFGGTLAALLIPVAYGLAAGATGFPVAAAVLAGAASLLFNLLFSASTLGFGNLMQGIVAEANASGRLFGIQGTIQYLINGAAILGLSLIFASFGLGAAFWITAGIYAALGLFQLLLGPRLLFTPQERGQKK